MPIFVLLLAAGYISWGALQDADRASQTADVIDSLDLQDRAGTAVATERGVAMLALNDSESVGEDQLVAAQEASDEAVDARNEALRALDTDELSTSVRDAIEATLDDRRELDELQRQVLSGQISETSATQRYTEIIERALDVPRALSASSNESGLAERLNAYIAMDEVMLANTYERPLVALGLANAAGAQQQDEDNPDYNAQLMQRMVVALKETNEFRVSAQEQIDRLGMDYTLPAYSEELQDLRFQLEYLNFSQVNPADAAQWAELSQGWIDDMQPVRNDVRLDTVTYSRDLSDDARLQAVGTVASAFGIVLLSLVFALVIARRIVTPLRRLTTATAEVRDRLPEMVEQMAVPGQTPSTDLVEIPVESSDEIGRLANAFNEVNATTMEVAREQAALRGSIAEMFVNVARRDQVLLNRQLAFLDELERSEEDPSTLSNLFRLDHLATRMRRNAESLLVLAGIDSGRRVRTPMPVSDVIRTASSEIELYDRVRLDLHTDPQMLGHNALNAAHLIAELLENATMFSEPHTPVEVITGSDTRGVVVTVRDHGLGMSAQEIADANAKVTSAAASDAVGAQRLGLFVVGRLAGRLGAQVEFSTGQDGKGTVVVVVFPAALFLADDAVTLPQPTDPLEAATQRSASQLGSAASASELTGAVPATVPTADAPREPEPAPTASAASAQDPAASAPEAPRRTVAPASFGMTEPEPPVAEPVDLDALTDGTTATGMPRRRRGDGGAPTESIVLPPLETPSLEESAPGQEDAAWTPPSEVEASAASLPSRRRSGAGRSEPAALSGSLPLPSADEAPAKPIEVEQRTGLFSSFRSMENLGESTLQLDAVSDDPADLPAQFEEHAAAAYGVADEPPAREPVDSGTPYAPESFAPEPVRSEPSEPRADEPYVPQHDAAGSSWAPEPSPATAPSPVAAARAAEAQDAPEADDHGFTALPAFEDLMSDLPTRRSDATAQNPRKRGLFGRRPAVQGTASTASGPATGPSAPALVGSADGVDPLTTPQFRSSSDSPDPAPERRSVVDPFAPAVTRAERAAPPLATPEPAEVPWGGPAEQTATRPEAAPVAFGRAPVQEVPYVPGAVAPEPAPAPAPSAPVAPTPVADETRPAATSYGESVLPLRSTADMGSDPLDPHFVPDTVEARSEWMASAVLYEEMSTLMQRGVFQEENVTISNDEQTYRPTSVAPTAANGLARRGRSPEPSVPAERFTASIDRDPEQLRARLSAFQSATARGRTEAMGPGGSTDAYRA
ncbi:sensor histidine kinase [Isoptericola aurantiacus]|uniref:sensor histidine kinase n=1 Tax=Isoptericola aurantiacus TaxID=3377839 RepID=UPI00383BD309